MLRRCELNSVGSEETSGGIKPSSRVRSDRFPDQMSYCQLLEDSAPLS